MATIAEQAEDKDKDEDLSHLPHVEKMTVKEIQDLIVGKSSEFFQLNDGTDHNSSKKINIDKYNQQFFPAMDPITAYSNMKQSNSAAEELDAAHQLIKDHKVWRHSQKQ